MDKLELILYDIGHGLAISIIEYPEKYVTHIDLGAEGDFSPLGYLYHNRSLRPDILFITHPHGDHLADVKYLDNADTCPNYICYQEYDWKDVMDRERKETKENIQLFEQVRNSIRHGNYNGKAKLKKWAWTPKQAREKFGDNRYINNSSLFIVYTWQDFKISICGDLETDGMESMINFAASQNEAKGTNILIAPHHGHDKGYTSLWPNIIGKPSVSLISVQRNNPNIASGYDSPSYANGIPFDEETRYSLNTRKDQTLFVNMYYKDGKPIWRYWGQTVI